MIQNTAPPLNLADAPSSQNPYFLRENEERDLIEATLNTPFALKKLKTLLILLLGDAIKVQPESPGFYIDLDNSRMLLQRIVGHDQEKQPQNRIESDQISNKEIEAAFRNSLRALLKTGLVPGFLMGQISRILKPSDIRVTDSTYARFFYGSDFFPKKTRKPGRNGDWNWSC